LTDRFPVFEQLEKP